MKTLARVLENRLDRADAVRKNRAQMVTRIAAVLLLAVTTGAFAQPSPTAPLFRFEANSFWLNLHHFLYVLGRAQNKTPDSSRDAVAGAPAEAAAGLAALTADEQKVWAD